MPKVRTARNVRFVNSREQELHCRRVERRLETDSWGIWWGSRAANEIAGSTLVAHQLQSQRRVMAVQRWDMAFHKHDIDHWMDTLPTFVCVEDVYRGSRVPADGVCVGLPTRLLGQVLERRYLLVP